MIMARNSNSIFNMMDELFEFSNHNSVTYSKSEFRKTDDGYVIDVLLPGFTKEEVNVSVEKENLIIEAKTERKLPRFINSTIKKTFHVEEINADSVNAKLENGILSVSFSNTAKSIGRTIAVL